MESEISLRHPLLAEVISNCSFKEARYFVDCINQSPDMEYTKLKDSLYNFCLAQFSSFGDFQSSGVWMPYQELAKNSVSNGPVAGERIARIGRTEKLLLFGLGDGGEYFKKEEVKKMWESGQKIPTVKGRFINAGGGLQDILEIFPYVFVDTQTSIFYTGRELGW